MHPSLRVGRAGQPGSLAARAMTLVIVGLAQSCTSPERAIAQGPRAGYMASVMSLESRSLVPTSADLFVRSTERSVGTSVRNGAAIGALVGLVTGALVYSACRGTEPGGTNCPGKAVLSFGILTAAGAGIGYLVGASDPDPNPGN